MGSGCGFVGAGESLCSGLRFLGFSIAVGAVVVECSCGIAGSFGARKNSSIPKVLKSFYGVRIGPEGWALKEFRCVFFLVVEAFESSARNWLNVIPSWCVLVQLVCRSISNGSAHLLMEKG